MPTDHHPSTRRMFDPHSAQLASLDATISRVRFRRRVRRTAAASVILMAVSAAVWLAIPAPTLQPGPQPVADSIRIPSIPLTVEQKVVSSVTPGLYIRTPTDSSIAVRITTSPDTTVPRLGESEFRALLAAHDAYLIQISGAAPEIRRLHAKNGGAD